MIYQKRTFLYFSVGLSKLFSRLVLCAKNKVFPWASMQTLMYDISKSRKKCLKTLHGIMLFCECLRNKAEIFAIEP